MSAPPPPPDPDALAYVDRLRRHPDVYAGIDPKVIPNCSPAHITYLVADAQHDIVVFLATIADLRSKLAAVEGERDETITANFACEREVDASNRRAWAAEAERDALAGMAGLIAGTWAKALSDEQESHRVTDIMAEVGFGMMMDAGDEVCSIQDRLAAAETRAREAEARAERYATLLQPLAYYAATALPPEGVDGEIACVVRGAYRRSISTANLRNILAEFPQPQETVDERF